MCCRTLLDPAAREVLKPTLLELCRQSFKQLLDKEKAAQAKQVTSSSTHVSLRIKRALRGWCHGGEIFLVCADGIDCYSPDRRFFSFSSALQLTP